MQKKYRIAAAAHAAMLLSLMAHQARSQTASADTAQSGAGADNATLTEILVTAQKRTERLVDVPISVNAQTADQLERSGVENTADLPLVIPGLIFTGTGAWVQPNLRGVSTTITSAGADNPIALYVDGVYQPAMTGMLFNLPDVSRIEVLKGPQGTLFGRNATGGAIEIFTRDPSFTLTGRFTAKAGVFSGGSAITSGVGGATAFISGPLFGDVVAASLAGGYENTEGYLRNIATGDRTGQIRSSLVRGKLLFVFNDSVRFTLTGYYQNQQDYQTEAGALLNGVTVAAGYPGAIIATRPWETSYDTPRPYVSAQTAGTSLRGTIDIAGGTVTTTTGYTKVNNRENVDVDAATSQSCLLAFACTPYLVTTPQNTLSEEVTFASRRYFDRLGFVAGIFAYYDHAGQAGEADGGAFTFATDVYTHAYAAFTEFNLALTNKLTGIAGVRYSWESKFADGDINGRVQSNFADKVYRKTTPRVSLRYAFTDTTNAYVTYSEGFKSGTLPGQIGAGSPANPEYLKSYEFGAKTAQDRYALNAAVFYYDYKDLQVQYFSGTESYPANAATAELYGLDVDGTVQATQALQFRLGLSYLPKADYINYPAAIAFAPPLTPFGLTTYNSFNASGTRILKTPKVTSTLSATFTIPFAGGALESTGLVYYSSNYRWEVTDRVQTRNYALLNGDVTFTPANSKLKISLFGKNLANKAYINSTLLDSSADMVMHGPPREVGVRLEFAF